MNDKQIEEEIHKLKIAMCSYEDCEECPTSWCYAEECATMAICKGYRKIPEGSVILTKEEYDNMQFVVELIGTKQKIGACDFNRIVLQRAVQARKQAVKDFIQAINKEYELFDDEDEIFFSCLRKDIKKIAKEFGVEL